jgi:dihydroorotate dehydrogenase
VGLAAGFDKNAEILTALPDLGFGFAEIGTVTPRPQLGNEKPRLFRWAKSQKIFNRMGFNSDGAALVARRLAHYKPQLPTGFRVGVNIGKNKETPNEKAYEDYRDALRPFRDLADYVVVNVSSPNTPGLRSLQSRTSLAPILNAVHSELELWKRRPPLFLKLAPELDVLELQDLLMHADELHLDGIIITNTLAGSYENKPGGYSGAVLTDISREVLMKARTLSKLPIISVGGVMNPAEARARRRLGADLVQIYSGWIFGGPRFPRACAEEWMKF